MRFASATAPNKNKGGNYAGNGKKNLAPFRASGDGIGVFSANGAYHFQRPKSKLVPFVTGGYSLAFRSFTSSGGNFGGGVQYWMKDHLGLRFEVRDHVFSSDSPHFFQFRVGLSF